MRDSREDPRVPAWQAAAAVFFTGLLRIRSFNALEPRLSEKSFLRLMDSANLDKRLCAVDTLGRSLRGSVLGSVRELSVGIVAQAERNKVFREGWHGAMHYVALDGWEPISTSRQHCEGCLVRQLQVKGRDGELREVDQYYHRFVVALLLDERFDLALDIEPMLPADLRPGGDGKGDQDEGELTAAKRLLPRLKKTFGWLEVVVADGLYTNGPFLTLVEQLGMGAVFIARKEKDEPLREARRIWRGQKPEQVIEDPQAGERVEVWDCPGLQTLDSYKGTIRMVLGRVSDLGKPGSPRDWCMAVTGRARRLSARKVLAVARGRWHIENTGFHQWTSRWHFAHVFTHDHQGIQALYWLFFAAYNLLTLFLYRQLRCYGRDRGKDVTRTISRLVDEMLDDLARLDAPLWDTS